MHIDATNGNANAVEARDLVAKKLTKQQVLTAQKLAKACQANNYKHC